MKIWQFAVLGLLGLAVAGCRSDPSVALLERDNRLKEDEIYRLQDRIAELEGTLQGSAPSPGISVGTQIPRTGRPGEMSQEPGPEVSPLRSTAPPRNSPPENTPPPDTFRSPRIELPGESLPPNQIPDTLRVPDGSRTPGDAPRRVAPPGGGGSTQWKASGDNSQVAQITLHPSLTGGVNNGGRAGDEGLLVVVEPRDFSGNIVDTAGDVSIALLDPALSGEQARLARWDFTAAQTAGMVRSGSQRGIHVQVPWNSAAPAHDRLKVFVRYTTRDGRKLQAERVIGVALGEVPAVNPPQTATRPEWSPLR